MLERIAALEAALREIHELATDGDGYFSSSEIAAKCEALLPDLAIAEESEV